MTKITLTDEEKHVIDCMKDSVYTSEFVEEWVNRGDNVSVNAPSALQAMGAKGFYRAVKHIVNDVCEPKYLGENKSIGCRDGECNCGNIVRSYQNYCDGCGIRLCWDNVHG